MNFESDEYIIEVQVNLKVSLIEIDNIFYVLGRFVNVARKHNLFTFQYECLLFILKVLKENFAKARAIRRIWLLKYNSRVKLVRWVSDCKTHL